MQKLTVFSTLVLATALLVACNEGKSTITEPTPTRAAPAGVSAEIKADRAMSDPAGGVGGCQGIVIPLRLSIRTGDERLLITGINMQFVASSGVPMPQVTLPAPLPFAPAPPTAPAPIPTTQFGSDLIEARSLATFPLSFPLGCVNDLRGTIIVVVGTRDTGGRSGSIEARTELR